MTVVSRIGWREFVGRSSGVTLMLVTVICAFLLRQQRLDWDALAFVAQAKEPGWVDLAHLGYVPLLRGFARVSSWFGLDLINSCQLLSALGGGLATAAAAGVYGRLSGSRTTGMLVALLVVTALDVFDQFTRVEVYAPALAMFLISLRCAVEFRRTDQAAWRWGAMFGLGAAAMLHLATLSGVPAVLFLCRGAMPQRGRLVCALGIGFALIAVLARVWLWDGVPAPLVELGWRVRSFLPGRGSPTDLMVAMPAHAHQLWRFAVENSPILSGLGVAAVSKLLWVRASAVRLVGLWCLPPIGLFLVTGVPFLGLVLPTLFGLGLAISVSAPRGRHRSFGWGALGLAIVVQLVTTFPDRLDAARRPDPWVAQSRRLVRSLEPDVALLTGLDGRHIQFHGALPNVVLLPDRIHAAWGIAPQRPLEEIVYEIALDQRRRGRSLRITYLGLRYLHDRGLSLDHLRGILRSSSPRWRDPADGTWQVFDLEDPLR